MKIHPPLLLTAFAALVCWLLLLNTPVTAGLIFDVSQSTHAVVDFKTPVLNNDISINVDTSNTFPTGYIYNAFGAANVGIEGTGNMLFADGLPINFINFHTAVPINLTSVALVVGGEGGNSNGNRGFSSFSFQQFTDATYTVPVGTLFSFTNLGNISSYEPNVLSTPISNGQYFQLSIVPSQDQGVRVISFTGVGVVPEPSLIALLGLLGIVLLAVRYRPRRRSVI